MKRQRGRGRKPSNPSNRSYESNGPDVKIRGNASQVYEKYLQYARDAQTSGDRIAAEAYFQHAEHYFRIMAANAPKDRPPQQDDQNNASDDDRRDEQSANDGRADEQDNSEDESKSVDGLRVVDGDGEQPAEIKAEDAEPKKTSSRSRSSSGRGRTSRSRSSRNASSETNSEEKSSAGNQDDDAGLRSMMARSAAPDLPPEPVEQADS